MSISSNFETHLSEQVHAFLDIREFLDGEEHTLFDNADAKGSFKVYCNDCGTEKECVVIKIEMTSPTQESSIFEACLTYQDKKPLSMTFEGKVLFDEIDETALEQMETESLKNILKIISMAKSAPMVAPEQHMTFDFNVDQQEPEEINTPIAPTDVEPEENTSVTPTDTEEA